MLVKVETKFLQPHSPAAADNIKIPVLLPSHYNIVQMSDSY